MPDLALISFQETKGHSVTPAPSVRKQGSRLVFCVHVNNDEAQCGGARWTPQSEQCRCYASGAVLHLEAFRCDKPSARGGPPGTWTSQCIFGLHHHDS